MTVSKKYVYKITDDPNHSASKIIALLQSNLDVLEVGCASGVQTRYLKETMKCRVTGIEIDEAAAEDARSYCERLIIGNIEALDLATILGEKRFDIITFADVLEHLNRPSEALIKVRPFIKEGGYLIASIPNIAHAAICWELAHGRFDYQTYGLLDNTHIRFFTKKNVAKLFDESGYKIVSWDRITKDPEEIEEFGVHCASDEDQTFLDWIYKNNAEARTYQFILKAQPIPVGELEITHEHLNAIDTIKKLEAKIEEQRRQYLKLESQINWLKKNRFGPLSRLYRRIYVNKMRVD